MRFDGKVALVTGAARGQGANHCRRLAREGAQVVAIDICKDVAPFYPMATKSELDGVVDECRGLGVGAIGVTADVRSWDQMASAVSLAAAEFGRVDILCNNAGVARVDAIDEMPEDVLDVVIAINLKGIFTATRSVVPMMKQRGYGKIVSIASAAGIRPLAHLSHYSATKGAVIAATKSWAAELGPWGINVNCIAPGTLLTSMITGLADQLRKNHAVAFDEFNASSLFRGERATTTLDDVSDALLYLVSDESRMVTGQVISVDGGKTGS